MQYVWQHWIGQPRGARGHSATHSSSTAPRAMRCCSSDQSGSTAVAPTVRFRPVGVPADNTPQAKDPHLLQGQIVPLRLRASVAVVQAHMRLPPILQAQCWNYWLWTLIRKSK